jgi:hypothetical protein
MRPAVRSIRRQSDSRWGYRQRGVQLTRSGAFGFRVCRRLVVDVVRCRFGARPCFELAVVVGDRFAEDDAGGSDFEFADLGVVGAGA